MPRVVLLAAILVALKCLASLAGATASAGGVAATCRTGSRAQERAQVALVPFAVPVAVPVAVVARPTVFYGYTAWPAAATSAAAPAAARAVDEPSTLTGEAARILTRYCAGCHTPPTNNDRPALFDRSGQLPDRLPRQAILEAVGGGPGKATMPPEGRPRLSAEEIETLTRWARPPRELLY